MNLTDTVEKGAAFLDETQPGWEDTIDLPTLNLRSPCNCVLGQLWRAEHPRSQADNPYDTARRRWGIGNTAAASSFGFDRGGSSPWSWEGLTREWRKAIRARRAARTV